MIAILHTKNLPLLPCEAVSAPEGSVFTALDANGKTLGKVALKNRKFYWVK